MESTTFAFPEYWPDEIDFDMTKIIMKTRTQNGLFGLNAERLQNRTQKTISTQNLLGPDDSEHEPSW